jgi:hypothetical protein
VTVFISSQSVDTPPASLLIDGLRRAGIAVEHSPRNPAAGHDPRWEQWYAKGLRNAFDRCNVFVAVVDSAWDSSSWMAIEADEARRRLSSAFYWNPQGLKVAAAGMKPYLAEELPPSVDAAVRTLVQRGAG